jgi:cation transport protein ChaC
VYDIDPQYADDVQAYMDHREKDGYSLEQVDVYGVVDGKETIIQKAVRRARVAAARLSGYIDVFCLFRADKGQSRVSGDASWFETPKVVLQVYVGHSTNPSFLGPAPLSTLATRIATSIGPSGANKVRTKKA